VKVPLLFSRFWLYQSIVDTTSLPHPTSAGKQKWVVPVFSAPCTCSQEFASCYAPRHGEPLKKCATPQRYGEDMIGASV